MFVKRFSEKIPDFFHYLETNRHFSGLFLCQHLEHDLTPERLLLRDRFRGLLEINSLRFLSSTVLGAFVSRFPSWWFYYTTSLRCCQGFFQISLKFFLAVFWTALPWNNYSIPQPIPFCKWQCCTNSGFFLIDFLCALSIDFLCGMWYNGKFGRAQSRPAGQKGEDFTPRPLPVPSLLRAGF